jgi:hypothetical protein
MLDRSCCSRLGANLAAEQQWIGCRSRVVRRRGLIRVFVNLETFRRWTTVRERAHFLQTCAT